MSHPRTIEKTLQHIEEGHGIGHGDTYKPWLIVTRKNASKTSNQVVCRMPGYRRASHFFARAEFYLALLCIFLGALDVREQFPLWPMPHPHPLAEGIVDWRLPQIPGLMSIAKEAGVRHGTVVGTKWLPYVATIDLMITLVIEGAKSLAGLSIKPYDDVTRAEPTDRLIERQEMERRYMVHVDGHFVIADYSILTKVLRGNLEMLAAFAGESYPDDSQTTDLFSALLRTAENLPFSTSLRCAAKLARLSQDEAARRIYCAAWHRRIDIDITKPMRADLPLAIGSRPIIAALQRELLGCAL